MFHIPDNRYTYTDAKAVCHAFGADIATYDQLEEAYAKGADFCSYGWSKDQLALFPTQKKHYDALQHIPGHEHDCGRPGINGGYMDNPKLRLGVNCYGVKPPLTVEDNTRMKEAEARPYPETEADREFQESVDYWKQRIQQLTISPFAPKQWNEFT